MEMYGVPIAYMPYFATADPSVKRKSGFLAPVFAWSEPLGFGVGVPYFWAMAPNYDLTLKPIEYTKRGPFLDTEFRYLSEWDRLMLNVAFNYSGRHEIVDAARRCVADGLTAEQIDEDAIDSRLYTVGLPPLDLLIRTGREHRISNFLIWQAQYAELYFTDLLWPDFGPAALDAALVEFASRHRRFGR